MSDLASVYLIMALISTKLPYVLHKAALGVMARRISIEKPLRLLRRF